MAREFSALFELPTLAEQWIEQGRVEGREEGREEGEAIGLEKGREEGQRQTALDMLRRFVAKRFGVGLDRFAAELQAPRPGHPNRPERRRL